MRRILVTGSAGFIGFHLCRLLLDRGFSVTGIDNLNDYYDPNLKKARLGILEKINGFKFVKMDISERDGMNSIFSNGGFERVVHLAAQPGVRYSLINPHAYVESNITGFLNVLECSRRTHVKHLLFASSSSVYGANKLMPFSVHRAADHPVSLYGATKKAGELMAHTYASLYGLPCTGLRFFTVYGQWGRPDMAYYLFTKAIIEDTPIEVFNRGEMKRDFTYIDDVINALGILIDRIPSPNPDWDPNSPDPASSYAPYRLYNVGNNNPVSLLRFIEVLEECIGKKAIKKMLPIQAGDVVETYADIDDLSRDSGFSPNTPIEEGLKQFVKWYRDYHGV